MLNIIKEMTAEKVADSIFESIIKKEIAEEKLNNYIDDKLEYIANVVYPFTGFQFKEIDGIKRMTEMYFENYTEVNTTYAQYLKMSGNEPEEKIEDAIFIGLQEVVFNYVADNLENIKDNILDRVAKEKKLKAKRMEIF